VSAILRTLVVGPVATWGRKKSDKDQTGRGKRARNGTRRDERKLQATKDSENLGKKSKPLWRKSPVLDLPENKKKGSRGGCRRHQGKTELRLREGGKMELAGDHSAQFMRRANPK